MIWFMAFTSLGLSITLFLLIMKWAYRPSIKGWISGAALLAFCSFLAQK
jgi:hypothetical protein